jgi:hypothetical protein
MDLINPIVPASAHPIITGTDKIAFNIVYTSYLKYFVNFYQHLLILFLVYSIVMSGYPFNHQYFSTSKITNTLMMHVEKIA